MFCIFIGRLEQISTYTAGPAGHIVDDVNEDTTLIFHIGGAGYMMVNGYMGLGPFRQYCLNCVYNFTHKRNAFQDGLISPKPIALSNTGSRYRLSTKHALNSAVWSTTHTHAHYTHAYLSISYTPRPLNQSDEHAGYVIHLPCSA